jgi:hypothetical protein
MGEKYMRWYYRQVGHNYLHYDVSRFKVAHCVCGFLVGFFGLLAIALDHNTLFLALMFIALIMNYVLILTWCKKKDFPSE